MISEEKRKSRLAGPSSRKVKFTKAEDATLAMLVKELGTKDWKNIAQHMQPRTARQCRERWTNYVNPTLSQEPWTQEEDILLIEKHCEFGNHWKIIERCFPSRSKNNIKHRWSLLQSLVNNTPSPSLNLSTNSASNPNLLISNSNSLPMSTSSASVTLSNDSILTNTSLDPLSSNDDISFSQSMPSINMLNPHVSQHVQPAQQQRLVQPILQTPQQITPLMPQINRVPQIQENAINSVPLSFYLNSNSINNNRLSTQSPIVEEKPTDTFQYFDRILDTHEMYINEIDNGETWSFPDENSFFKIM